MKRITIFLLLCGICFGVPDTHYVNPASTDDTGDGSTPTAGTGGTSAEKTLAAAIAASTSGDTIKLVDGEYSDTTQGAAWEIQFTAAASGLKTLTISPYIAGTTIAMTSTGARFIELEDTNITTQTLNNLNITLTGTTKMLIRRLSGCKSILIMNDCTMDSTGSTAPYLAYLAESTYADSQNLFYNCTFIADETVFYMREAARILLDHCTVTADSFIDYITAADIDSVEIVNGSTITLADNTALYGYVLTSIGEAATLHPVDQFIIRDSTISVANGLTLYPDRPPAKTLIENSTITGTDAGADNNLIDFGMKASQTTDWAEGQNIALGTIEDSDGEIYICIAAINPTAAADKPSPDSTRAGANWQSYWKPYEFGTVVLNNVTAYRSTAASKHVVLFGQTLAPGCSMTNCKIYNATGGTAGGDWQVVGKCGNILFQNNTIVGPQSLACYARDGNKIINNSIASNDVFGLSLSVQDTYNYSTDNIVVGNTVVQTGADATDYAVYILGGSTSGTFTDKNCIYAPNGGTLYYLNDAAKATIALTRTYWEGIGQLYIENEDNSIVANPQLNALGYPMNPEVIKLGAGRQPNLTPDSKYRRTTKKDNYQRLVN